MLSIRKEVQVLQIININIVVFLIFSIVFHGIFGVEFENFVFITVCLGSICIYLVYILLKDKVKHIKVVTIFLAIFMVGIFFYKFDMMSAIIYGIYSALIVWYAIDSGSSTVSYTESLTIAKGIIILSLVMLLLYFFRGEDYFNSVINYYFILIPLNIVILRISRAIGNQLEDKNMRRVNLVIIVAILILITDIGQKIGAILFKGFTTTLSFVAEKFLFLLAAIFYYPAIFLSRGLEYLGKILKKGGEYQQQEIQQIGERGDLEEILAKMANEESHIYSEQAINITKIIIVIIIVAIIFIILKKLMSNKTEEGYEEIIETIEDIQRRHAFRNKLKEFMNRDKSIRGRILFAYKRFITTCEMKGIYNEKFTATELSKEVDGKINSREELGEIRDIYNEAKYSNHDMEEYKAETIENDVAIINKKIGGKENGDK